MRDYGKVAPQFWIGETGKLIRAKGSPAQTMALYLLTGPQSNMVGLYYLPLPQAAHETGMTLDEALAAIADLCDVGFCVYDDDTDQVFVIEMAKYQIEEKLAVKDNRRISIIKLLGGVKGPLRDLFLERYGKAFNLSLPTYPDVPHHRFPRSVAERLAERDGAGCRHCTATENITVDHIKAKINGGTRDDCNLQLLCAGCNSRKSASDRAEFWRFIGVDVDGLPDLSPTPTPTPQVVVCKPGAVEQEQKQEQRSDAVAKKLSRAQGRTAPAATDPEPSWGSVEALVWLYNHEAPPELTRVKLVSPVRSKEAEILLRRFPDRNFWESVFRESAKCPVLLGQRPSEKHPHWKADFDWFIGGKVGVENAVKVLEGKYNDEGRKDPKQEEREKRLRLIDGLD